MQSHARVVRSALREHAHVLAQVGGSLASMWWYQCLWKNTPLDKKTFGNISLKNTESGAGEEFMFRCCRAKARGNFFHRHRYCKEAALRFIEEEDFGQRSTLSQHDQNNTRTRQSTWPKQDQNGPLPSKRHTPPPHTHTHTAERSREGREEGQLSQHNISDKQTAGVQLKRNTINSTVPFFSPPCVGRPSCGCPLF